MKALKRGHEMPDPGWCGDRTRGAGYGRPSDLYPETTETLTLRRVRLVDGDYDEGGAYWGGGDDSPGVWVARDADGQECYVRAWSRDEAKAKFPRATWAPTTVEDHMSAFFPAYVRAALWSTCGDDPDFEGEPQDNPGGVPLDRDHGPEDLSPECEASMRDDCVRFLDACAGILENAVYHRRGDKWAQAGHDFWLTRCGHGCGFRDGDWSEPHGELLTNASKRFREPYLYVGDDGRVHT